jgi:multidrug resistance efflux pump
MDFKRAAVYALGVTLTLSACSQGPQRQAPPLSVDVAAASRQNIATYVSLDGQVAPLEQSVLAFQQNGTITSISVNVGDRVRSGQVLARIDDSRRRNRRRRRRSSNLPPRRARKSDSRFRSRRIKRRCKPTRRHYAMPSSSMTKIRRCIKMATSHRHSSKRHAQPTCRRSRRIVRRKSGWPTTR